jgi:hypothetical protein
MVVFQCPQLARQLRTPICFPAVKQGLILKWKAEKALVWMSMTSTSDWWLLFHKEVKSRDSTTWFRICPFQTLAWKRYLQMHLLAERFVLLGVNIGVFWGNQDLCCDSNVASLLDSYSSDFTSIVNVVHWIQGLEWPIFSQGLWWPCSFL